MEESQPASDRHTDNQLQGVEEENESEGDYEEVDNTSFALKYNMSYVTVTQTDVVH